MRFLFLSIAVGSLAAFGQQAPSKVITFDEGDVLEAGPATPDVELVRAGHVKERKSIIRVRENFADKVMESAHEL